MMKAAKGRQDGTQYQELAANSPNNESFGRFRLIQVHRGGWESRLRAQRGSNQTWVPLKRGPVPRGGEEGKHGPKKKPWGELKNEEKEGRLVADEACPGKRRLTLLSSKSWPKKNGGGDSCRAGRRSSQGKERKRQLQNAQGGKVLMRYADAGRSSKLPI